MQWHQTETFRAPVVVDRDPRGHDSLKHTCRHMPLVSQYNFSLGFVPSLSWQMITFLDRIRAWRAKHKGVFRTCVEIEAARVAVRASLRQRILDDVLGPNARLHANLARKTVRPPSFSAFPYGCPEPVLVNVRVLLKQMTREKAFLT